jgi:hypothetical protein
MMPFMNIVNYKLYNYRNVHYFVKQVDIYSIQCLFAVSVVPANGFFLSMSAFLCVLPLFFSLTSPFLLTHATAHQLLFLYKK